jgi:hypothetical protein
MLSIQTNECCFYRSTFCYHCFCQSTFCYHGAGISLLLRLDQRVARWRSGSEGGEPTMHRLSGGCSFGCWAIYTSAVIPRLLGQMEGLGSMYNRNT